MKTWKIFNPKRELFDTQENYLKYRENVRCGVCHEKLKNGDKFDLRSIQTKDEMEGNISLAVVVHRKCVEKNKKQ